MTTDLTLARAAAYDAARDAWEARLVRLRARHAKAPSLDTAAELRAALSQLAVDRTVRRADRARLHDSIYPIRIDP